MSKPWAEQSLLDRIEGAADRAEDRLRRVTVALEAAKIPYAIAGGHAIAAWVATVDPEAVRNTPDVDVLLRQTDLDVAEHALSAAGLSVTR